MPTAETREARIEFLARIAASIRHKRGALSNRTQHFTHAFETCPHPDCVAVRPVSHAHASEGPDWHAMYQRESQILDEIRGVLNISRPEDETKHLADIIRDRLRPSPSVGEQETQTITKCEGCGAWVERTFETDDGVDLCRPCFDAVPICDDEESEARHE